MTGYISNLCNLLKKVKKFLGVYFKKTGNISLPHKEPLFLMGFFCHVHLHPCFSLLDLFFVQCGIKAKISVFKALHLFTQV
jgi:hypothetical protein